jgi:hypothetical protein
LHYSDEARLSELNVPKWPTGLGISFAFDDQENGLLPPSGRQKAEEALFRRDRRITGLWISVILFKAGLSGYYPYPLMVAGFLGFKSCG